MDFSSPKQTSTVDLMPDAEVEEGTLDEIHEYIRSMAGGPETTPGPEEEGGGLSFDFANSEPENSQTIMSSWAEIQKLAADLQRVQLGDAAKKLSDRNCVEVVSKLTELSLVDLVYSIDGKDYITSQYLATQIKNECLGNKGRVNLVDLQVILNVEYQQIEAQVQEIIKTDSSFILSVGQLIAREYLQTVCREVNSRLQEDGHLTISQITKSYDLPSTLLQKEVYGALGGTIQGFADKDDQSFLYTKGYVSRQKAVLRGALSGLTKVTQVSHVISRCKLQPSLFFQLMDELLKSGEVRGQLTGGRHADRGVFIPKLYTDLVLAYAQDFYRQNNYIEFSSLKKLGITDTTTYLKEVLTEEEAEEVVILASCALSPGFWAQIVEAAEESISKNGWVDVGCQIPSEVSSEENSESACSLLQKVHGDWESCGEAFLYTDAVVATALKIFQARIEEKAMTAAPELMKLLKKEKENVSGGGAEESKGKKRGGKKGGGKKRGKDEDDESSKTTGDHGAAKIEFMNEDEIAKELMNTEKFEDCPEEILREVSERIRPELNAKFRAKLESVFMSSEADAASQLKKSHAEFQEQMKSLYQNICIFDSGAEVFDGNVCSQLKSYLLRTLCAEACYLSLSYVASVPAESLSAQKGIIHKLPQESALKSLNPESATAFRILLGSVSGKNENLEDFFSALYEVSGPGICALNLKQPDKKSRARMLKIHRAELEAQLSQTEEPASGLLLALLLLVSTHFDCAVHASGKFVPNLTSLIQSKIPQELALDIAEVQASVVKSLKSAAGSKKGKSDAATKTEGEADLAGKFGDLKGKVLAAVQVQEE